MATCPCGATFDLPKVQHGRIKRYCSARCRSRYIVRAWRKANPTKDAAADVRADERRRIKNAAHPELSKKREAARYATDPERHRARRRAYHAANRDKENARQRASRAADPRSSRASVRKWEAAHPERKAHYMAKYNARKRGNGGSHTFAEWEATCALFKNRCAYCGKAKSLTRDHNIPLSRGGTDDITNIVPSCLVCNSRKRTKTAAEFLAIQRLA
jgi:5-methylcytosine-specific restriction endonuclease McrA